MLHAVDVSDSSHGPSLHRSATLKDSTVAADLLLTALREDLLAVCLCVAQGWVVLAALQLLWEVQLRPKALGTSCFMLILAICDLQKRKSRETEAFDTKANNDSARADCTSVQVVLLRTLKAIQASSERKDRRRRSANSQACSGFCFELLDKGMVVVPKMLGYNASTMLCAAQARGRWVRVLVGSGCCGICGLLSWPNNDGFLG